MFFVNHSCCVLPTVAVELLMQLVPKTGNDKTETLAYYKNNTKTRKLSDSECIQEESLVNEITRIQTFEEQLSQQWKSDILETFYRKQTPKDSI